MPTPHYPCRLDCLWINSDDEFCDSYDQHGLALHTIEDFLLHPPLLPCLALDPSLLVPYNTPVSIPALDAVFGLSLPFRATAQNAALFNKGWSRASLCVSTERLFLAVILNGPATIIL